MLENDKKITAQECGRCLSSTRDNAFYDAGFVGNVGNVGDVRALATVTPISISFNDKINTNHFTFQETPYGPVYYSLKGKKGVVLCFHGTGGEAKNWSKQGEKLNFITSLSRFVSSRREKIERTSESG